MAGFTCRTERLILREATEDDAPSILAYLVENRSFLETWETLRQADYFSLQATQDRIKLAQREATEGRSLALFVYLQSSGELVGNLAFTNIIQGAFMSCFLGYKLSEKHANQGYMTEALHRGIALVFDEFGLHRIEANVMPRNAPSKRVLEKLGFEYEGRSRDYLKINGRWEDHEHYVLFTDRTI